MEKETRGILVLVATFVVLVALVAAAVVAPGLLPLLVVAAFVVLVAVVLTLLVLGRSTPERPRSASRIVLAAIAALVPVLLGLAVVVPNLLITGHPPGHESSAVAALRAYLSAQNTFHRSDFYEIGKLVYASPANGAGFPDLYRIGGPDGKGDEIKLIGITFAKATSPETAKHGYYFADLTAWGKTPYDPEIDCGLSAMPAKYNRTGRNVFIVDVTGTVYQRDAAALFPGIREGDPVPPVTVYPDMTEVAGWIPVGSE